jgi:hypothetical protein
MLDIWCNALRASSPVKSHSTHNNPERWRLPESYFVRFVIPKRARVTLGYNHAIFIWDNNLYLDPPPLWLVDIHNKLWADMTYLSRFSE